MEVDATNLANGIYLVKVEIPGVSDKIARIVIQK